MLHIYFLGSRVKEYWLLKFLKRALCWKGDHYEDLSDLEKSKVYYGLGQKRRMLGVVIYMTKMKPKIKTWEKKTNF